MSAALDKRHGHRDYIGGTIWCPRVERRIQLGLGHAIYSEFVCPGCGVRIPPPDRGKEREEE